MRPKRGNSLRREGSPRQIVATKIDAARNVHQAAADYVQQAIIHRFCRLTQATRNCELSQQMSSRSLAPDRRNQSVCDHVESIDLRVAGLCARRPRISDTGLI